MEQNIQTLIDLVTANEKISAEERATIIGKLKEADKKITIAEFKLDRTEKVKRTTAILLEETIEELKNKRKAVEVQNKELEIEAGLERVRAIALSMKEPADMLEVCKIIATELNKLGISEIRNVQTAIFYEEKKTYMNYEYYAKHNKAITTETSYTNHEIHQAFADQMLKRNGGFYSTHISKAEMPGWIAYQKTTNVFIDSYLETASSLNYHWFSLGAVALGISTYAPLKEDEIDLFKRFKNVFELAYRRYLDIEKAEAQAREAQIELGLERVRSRAMAMHQSNELPELIDMLFKELTKLGFSLDRCIVMIYDKVNNDSIWWVSAAPVGLFVKYKSFKPFEEYLKQWREGNTKWVYMLGGDEKKEWGNYIFYDTELSLLPGHVKDGMHSLDNIYLNVSFSSFGSLTFSTLEPLPEKEFDTDAFCESV